MFVRPNPTGHSEIGDGSTQYLCMRIDRTIAVKSTENITSFGVVTEFIYFARSTSGAVGVLPFEPRFTRMGVCCFKYYRAARCQPDDAHQPYNCNTLRVSTWHIQIFFLDRYNERVETAEQLSKRVNQKS